MMFQAHTPRKGQIAMARQFMEDEDAHASTLLAATQILFGPMFRAYEIDTLRKGFADTGVKVPQPNFDRLIAAITMSKATNFFWDAHVFTATVRAFAFEDIDPHALEHIRPEYMGWGIREADEILNAHLDSGEGWSGDYIDGEVLEMIVASLHEAGYCCAPYGLEWVQPYLDDVLHSTVLSKKVAKRWAALDKEKLADTAFEEDDAGVQLHNLAVCYLYYDAQEQTIRKQLGALLSA